MAFNVGELVAYLRLDMSDFERDMAKSQAQADRLDEKNVDVKVKADTAVAEAKLAEVAASEDRVDEGNKRIAASSERAGKGMGALANAIILLGPALVPVTAGVAGLTVGFGAMGAAGVLAIVGIKQQMTDGTALGGEYAVMLAGLKDDLSGLAATAAGGVLGPFQSAVADLQARMPELNGVVGEFSTMTGKAAGALTTGLVAAFLSLAPLARDASVYILGLSDRFASMMSGPGVVSFGEYVRSVFPQVMSIIESIGGAAIHLVAAFAPLGMGTLGILQAFASLINAIPVDVLSTLVQLASATYVGFQAFNALKGPINALSDAMLASAAAGRAWAVSTEVVTAGIRGLTIAAGGIAAVLSIGILVYSAFAEQQRQNTQAANDYADALRLSKGAIDDSIRATTAKNLADKGALDQANRLGISLSDVTDAAMGNAAAMERVKAVTDAATNISAPQASAAQQKLAGDANDLNATLEAQRQALERGIQSQKDYAAATTSTTAATDPQTLAMAALAAKIGTTSAALVTATAGQQTTAKAAADAAAKMYVENDAAGILKGSLDALNGKGLSLMQAQTASAAATNSATDSLKKNKDAIDGTSDAAIANQRALQAKAQASQAEAEAVGKATGSSEAAVKAYGDSKTALEASLKVQGLLTPAVQAYIDKLYDLSNLKVPPTKLDVDKAQADADIAALKAQIASIAAQPITLQFTANYSPAVAAALGASRAALTLSHMPGHAGGGLVTGPGSGTSDSILGVTPGGAPITRVSAGEYIVNAAATARNKALLDAINSGQGVSAAQAGPVHLDSGDMHAMAQMTAAAAAAIALGLSVGQSRTADNTRATQGRRW